MIPLDPLTVRVKDRYLKLAETIGEPRAFLLQFEAIIRSLEFPVGLIEDTRKVIERTTEAMTAPRDPSAPRTRDMDEAYPGFTKATNQAYDAWFRVSSGNAKLADVGHKLFLSILQTLTLPPALRKKVEMMSRVYMKTNKPRLKEYGNARYLEMLAQYEKFMAGIRSHLEVAQQAIEKGKGHVEDGASATKIKVGDFTLVNTGGFPEKTMSEVSDVVQKCQALLKSSGFGKVCYGEVQVTNTLSKGNILAFYLIASDELFIRANVRANADTLQTVLHELGHRLQYKFLGSKKRDIEKLYQDTRRQEERHQTDDEMKARKPKPGEEFKSKGSTYRVRDVVYDRGGYKVLLDGLNGTKAHIGLDSYLALKGESPRDKDPNYKGFVTNYASKNPGENFAEMFSFYCLGKLPVPQRGPLEEILFGSAKTAHDYRVLRVASRWIIEG